MDSPFLEERNWLSQTGSMRIQYDSDSEPDYVEINSWITWGGMLNSRHSDLALSYVSQRSLQGWRLYYFLHFFMEYSDTSCSNLDPIAMLSSLGKLHRKRTKILEYFTSPRNSLRVTSSKDSFRFSYFTRFQSFYLHFASNALKTVGS